MQNQTIEILFKNERPESRTNQNTKKIEFMIEQSQVVHIAHSIFFAYYLAAFNYYDGQGHPLLLVFSRILYIFTQSSYCILGNCGHHGLLKKNFFSSHLQVFEVADHESDAYSALAYQCSYYFMTELNKPAHQR